MKLSELIGKKIVNVYDGGILGTVGDSDLVIDPFSGDIESIILPNKSSVFNLWFQKQQLIIPWASIKKVGSEVIVVDIDESHSKMW
ncbi:YlmC/YmxH family sporulation protein [Candidatus Formimonas warabiya]|uniref:YlmC/YmxH family sporulation protein n=1 Tax=Formimonas warabiya TaxID=1761012 RepID=A0A3G1KPZ3_FORW1|nr:YlmC/YmxH family sporulation protein [Candidatus Formimonas warabiya]ATW24215.1 YlmC/YmxH family sporulation protein [Candidatus Formimonas warabiya]